MVIKKPEVSVIIPVYNAEKKLNSCLSSVLNQSYKNFEVIIVDNNSTDFTKEVILDSKEKNPKIKYTFEAKKGRGAARNAGIKIARGKIIAMTDSDCIVPRNWVEKITELIRENKEEVIQGGELDAIGNYWSKNIQLANEKFISRHVSKDKEYTIHLDTKNFAIRSSIIKSLMFDESIKNIEDFELVLRLRKIAKIRFLKNVKVRHYHKSSLMQFFAVQFDRAYWAYIIFQKHKSDSNIKKEVMFGSLSFWNYLFFPFWIIQQLASDRGMGFFLLISNIAWALGTFYAIIRKILNNFLLRRW